MNSNHYGDFIITVTLISGDETTYTVFGASSLIDAERKAIEMAHDDGHSVMYARHAA